MTGKLRKASNAILRMHPLALVGLFAIADILAGCIHWLHAQGILESRFFHMARDRGFGEIVQYLKFGVIILALSRWRRAKPSRLLTAWTVLFVVMLLDDAIGIHEAVGEFLLRFVPVDEPWGIRAKDLTEGVSFLLLEGSLCLYVAFRFLQASAALHRVSVWIALALVPLVSSSILLDLSTLRRTEDIAEMISMSILMATVHWQYRRAVGMADVNHVAGDEESASV